MIVKAHKIKSIIIIELHLFANGGNTGCVVLVSGLIFIYHLYLEFFLHCLVEFCPRGVPLQELATVVCQAAETHDCEDCACEGAPH